MNDKTNPVSVQSQLYDILVDLYSWAGLKRLAFTLAVPWTLFSLPNKRELARRLIEYLDDQNRLGCLVKQMEQTGHYQPPWSTALAGLPCVTAVQMQAVFPPEHYFREPPDYQAELAAVLSLDREAVTVTAAAADTVRLLIALPPASQPLDFPEILQKLHENSHRKLVALTLFNALSADARQAWQHIACNYPPVAEDGILRPAITWQQAWQSVQRRTAEGTSFPAAVSPPPPKVHVGESRPADSPLPPESPTSAWYQIVRRPDNDFLPRYQTGDYLLAQTDLGAIDFRLQRGQPILVMVHTPIEDTIQAEPYGKTPPAPARICVGYSAAEIEFLRTDAMIHVQLTSDGKPALAAQNQIKGIIIGVWQQPDSGKT